MRSESRDGQGLVELALVLPVVLFTALGFLEAGLLIGSRDEQARATQTVADYAALHGPDSWSGVAAAVLPGCTVALVATVPGIVLVDATCAYNSVIRLMFDGLPITTEASSAVNPPVSPPMGAP